MNIYEARRLNAERIALKFHDLLENGCLIFNENMEQVKSVQIVKTPWKFILVYDGFSEMRYLHDNEWDEGYHTSIKKFNARFDSFKILHPKNLVNLNQYKL